MSIADNWRLGRYGRTKIDAAGTTTAEGNFVAVKAVKGNLVYAAGCLASEGDPPAEDDTVVDGDVDWWPATKVVAKTGSAYVYYDREQ